MQENNNQEEATVLTQSHKSNGRNRRRCSNKVQNSAPQAPTCGLIEDTSAFAEKLSGQHNKGYVNDIEETPKAQEQTPVEESKIEESQAPTEEAISTPKEQESEKQEAPRTCKCNKNKPSQEKTEHSGPSFEETKETQKRALEVSLKKVPHKSEKIAEKDAVSYAKVSASIDKKSHKKSLGAKIRAFFSKLLGKKPKKNSKNFKNNKGGYRKNYKGKRPNNFDRNNKDFQNRPNNNNRRKNYNRRPNGNYNKAKTAQSSAPAAKE